MDHPRIDDEKILDHYLAGRLSPEDEALFEEHLFECASCLEQAQAGEELRRGLRSVAAEETARAMTGGVLAWIASRRLRAGLVAGLALAILLPAVLVWRHLGARAAAPTGDLLLISLGRVRDPDLPPPEVSPSPETDWVLLSLELPAVDAPRYRVTLLDAAGAELWRDDDLEPNLYDSLLVALPATFLPPGTYRVRIEARRVEGFEAAGEMSFRVATH